MGGIRERKVGETEYAKSPHDNISGRVIATGNQQSHMQVSSPERDPGVRIEERERGGESNGDGAGEPANDVIVDSSDGIDTCQNYRR